MVCAILEGRKTQTRRIVKPQPDVVATDGTPGVFTPSDEKKGRIAEVVHCPYGQPGDRLWVRESMRFDMDQGWRYEADGADVVDQDYGHKSPFCTSMFMPRSCSRITLEVTGARVERLCDISDDDVMAEGVRQLPYTEEWGHSGWSAFDDPDAFQWSRHPRTAFRVLWDEINAKSAPWASNPWVWVIEFKHLN
jgi:hypothetical protein